MKKSVVNEVAGYGMQFYNKYISLNILKYRNHCMADVTFAGFL